MKSLGGLGPSLKNFQAFPQVITTLKNGKLIFYPKWIRSEPNSTIRKDELKKNLGLNWSSINFPFNISDEVDELWIFKV